MLIGLLPLEIFRVFFREECALMMIKPPRQFIRGEILEVNNRVLISGEIIEVEQRSCTMQQALVLEPRAGPDALTVEARKQRSRASAIKTLVVIEDLDDQWIPF